MAELFLLGAQIFDITAMRRNLQRLAYDLHAVALEAFDLVRIVRQQMHRADPEIAQNLGADPVVA